MRDLRRYARQTNARLFIGFIVILFGVGLGLIYVIFGAGAALMGAVCLLAGLAPLGLIWAVLWGIDLAVRRANRD
jgi:hypothetical protein